MVSLEHDMYWFGSTLIDGSFPLFARYMIEGMGIQWAGTFLGCIAMALVPLPIYFYLRGAKIRERSQFAPTFPLATQSSAAPDQEESSMSEDVEKQK